MKYELRNIWEKLTGKVKPQSSIESCSVNYVWINENPVKHEQGNTLCGVPLRYLDKAIVNAKRYPNTPFNIWLDYALLDDKSRFFAESHMYFSAPANVKLRDLNDIPSYKKLELFKGPQLKDIWARADLARLLVLEHCLDTMNEKRALYTDFDVTDIRLDCKKMEKSLDSYGMFFGRAPYIENGYIAFQRSKEEQFLKDTLIPATIRAAQNNCNGYGAVLGELSNWATRNKLRNAFEKISGKRLPPMGYKIPENKKYKDYGIN